LSLNFVKIDTGLVANPGDSPDTGMGTVADAGVVADAVVVAAADVDDIIILDVDAGGGLKMNTLFADVIATAAAAAVADAAAADAAAADAAAAAADAAAGVADAAADDDTSAAVSLFVHFLISFILFLI